MFELPDMDVNVTIVEVKSLNDKLTQYFKSINVDNCDSITKRSVCCNLCNKCDIIEQYHFV